MVVSGRVTLGVHGELGCGVGMKWKYMEICGRLIMGSVGPLKVYETL